MKTFFRCFNNGVIAIVSADVYEEIQGYLTLCAELRKAGNDGPYPPYPGPIFTFCAQSRIDEGYGEFHTGSYELMDLLLQSAFTANRDFYVPFSNSTEHQDGPLGNAERMHRTTLRQAVEAFGLVPDLQES